MKKYLLSFSIFFLLLLASTIFLPYLFKDRIIATLREEANKNLTAQFDFDPNISINIFKSFPDISLGLRDVTISHQNKFKYDTLLSIDKAVLSVDLMDFYKEEAFRVKKITLIKPVIQLEYQNDSLYNWDIMLPDTATSESQPIDLAIDKLTIENARFVYWDADYDMLLDLNGLNHESSGQYNADVYTMASKTKVENILMRYDNISYINQWSVDQSGDISIDLGNDKYTFSNNALYLNGIETQLNGYIQLLEEAIAFDLTSKSVSSELNQYLTLIPAIYTSDYESIRSKGKGALSISLKGNYTDVAYPAFDLSMKITDGWFQYPDLIYPVSGLNLDAHIFSETGALDHTVVDLPVLNFTINKKPFEFSLLSKDLYANPYIKTKGKGVIDLADVMKVVPLEGYDLSGILDVDFDIEGKMAENMEDPISQLSAKGSLKTEAMHIAQANEGEAISFGPSQVLLNNQNLIIPAMEMKHGNNDVEFAGNITNFFDYLYGKGKLKGNMVMRSENLNLNDYMVSDTTTNDTTELEVIRIPTDINLQMAASIGKLRYDDLDLTDVSGRMIVRDGKLIMENLRSDLLGGSVSFNGAYNSVPEHPETDLDVSFTEIATDQLLRHFSLVKAFAPILEEIKALSSAQLKLSTPLNANMTPDLKKVSIQGLFSLADVQVRSLKAMQTIDQKLGSSHFNVKKLHDLLLNFKIENGELFIDPFDLKIDQSLLTLTGKTLLNGSIDYNGILQVPAGYVKNEVGIVNGLIANTKFTDFQLNPDEVLNLGISLGGSAFNPEIKLNLKEVKQSTESAIRSTLNNEVNKKKEETEEQLKKELDQLKESTEEAKNEVKEEMEKKKKEAEAELQRKKEEAKKEAEEKAKDAIRKLFK